MKRKKAVKTPVVAASARAEVRDDDDMKPSYSEDGNKDSGVLQNETRLKQVLKQADYDKVIPLLDSLEKNNNCLSKK